MIRTILCSAAAAGLLALTLPRSPAYASADACGNDPCPAVEASIVSDSGPPTSIASLLGEALAHNPELEAARAEAEAAQYRVAPARTLEDPTMEFGVINAPLPSLNLQREDMTMKMLGLSQKLPYPGKRSLREAVARSDAEGMKAAAEEVAHRLVRDVRVTYEELRQARSDELIIEQTRRALTDLAAAGEAGLSVGQGPQSEVLRTQAQIVQLQQELLQVRADVAASDSELRRLLGRVQTGGAISPTSAILDPLRESGPVAREAVDHRPQLQALESMVTKNEHKLELARREYYPDFELHLSYGQRDRTPTGTPRDDMISMTVSVNLPLWRKDRLGPMVAEARAMQRQSAAMLQAERLESRASLEKQLAVEQQSRDSARLYRSTLLPQLHGVTESTLAAYRVGRTDLGSVLDARLKEFEAQRAEAALIAAHNKSIAEIDLLVGASADTITGVQP